MIGMKSKWHGNKPDNVTLLFITLHQSNHFQSSVVFSNQERSWHFSNSTWLGDQWALLPCSNISILHWVSCFINQYISWNVMSWSYCSLVINGNLSPDSTHLFPHRESIHNLLNPVKSFEIDLEIDFTKLLVPKYFVFYFVFLYKWS